MVRKTSRDSISGYVHPSTFVSGNKLELLNTSGNLVSIDLSEIKCVFFVRDFSEADTPGRKTFTTRPRTEGLWVRLNFRDNDVLEGLLPNDLTQIAPEGYLVTPPDTRGNTQRIFVPRSALSSLTVLAVIGGMMTRRRGARPSTEEQVPMFKE